MRAARLKQVHLFQLLVFQLRLFFFAVEVLFLP